MPVGTCRLCKNDAEIQLSHVIPAFAFRWLSQSAGDGHLRATDAPNRRVQDGQKRHWLCTVCEERFSVWEGDFASKLFHPFTLDATKAITYTKWLLLFCTSLSWRVLQLGMDHNGFSDWTADAVERVRHAESVWRDVLLGRLPHPGLLQQHILPVERIESATGILVPNINRYLMRAIQTDILRAGDSVYTFTKIGRFIIIGFVHESNMDGWRGTKIHANDGVISPRKYVVPAALGDYLMEKARKLSETMSNISAAQQAKVEDAFRLNADKYVDSDAYDAMMADLTMFGKDAFRQS